MRHLAFKTWCQKWDSHVKQHVGHRRYKDKKRTTFGSTDITASGRDGRKLKHNGHSIGYSSNFTARIETTAAPQKRRSLTFCAPSI